MVIERDDKLAGIWTHDEVECRLREACTTLMRSPMPRHGMPRGNRASWPDFVRDAADRAGARIGAASDEQIDEFDADRNRTRLNPSNEQIAEMDEALQWLLLIHDKRARKVVFARCHVHEESGRHMASYAKIARKMGTNRETARQWYRAGIRRIAMASNRPTEN